MFDEPVKSQKSRHSCASRTACGGTAPRWSFPSRKRGRE